MVTEQLVRSSKGLLGVGSQYSEITLPRGQQHPKIKKHLHDLVFVLCASPPLF